ncbi:hypothetical protein EX30DRAFT_340331 [Ascodesmis nigricans]|uniref:Protein BCP1 n=1 Tax=Ascodesmis nigricans TaxID=341454 RepID=A0A4S2MYQ8_9PEZI|nr:hypothetical protein EX30DRAFT_340331 [Ascodesmis nigricans]
MPKRKTTDPHHSDLSDTAMPDASQDSDSDASSTPSLINVDFEYFDPQPQDFHGLRTLLRQLFSSDSPLFDLSSLSDLILSQPTIGTTIKTDGNESDPYAFMTVLNLNVHKNHPAVRGVVEYLFSKAGGEDTVLGRRIRELVSRESSGAKGAGDVGLILTERLINLPAQLAPPMYKMLAEELEWAVLDGEPYHFAEFLVLSKTYTEVESKLDLEEKRPLKRGKKKGKKAGEVFYYHPEDEVVRRAVGEERCKLFEFTKEGEAADSKRAFSDMGVKMGGVVMMVEREQMGEVVKELERLFQPAS